MERPIDVPDYVVRVRPRAVLLRTALLSYVLLSIPLFGVLYFLGAPYGSWPIGLAFQLATVLVGATCFLLYRRTFIGVTASAVHERSFFGGISIRPLSAAFSAVLVRTYRSSSIETFHQLLVSDADGNRVLRMRGMFWNKADMTAVVEATNAELTDRTGPMTVKAFFDEYPGGAYWFENNPILAVLAMVGMVAVVTAVVLGLMFLLGIPLDS